MKTQGQQLQVLYKKFQSRGRSLSQRAFAKYLGIDASRLHDFMMDKRVMSPRMVEKVCDRLGLGGESKEKLLEAVSALRARKKRRSPPLRLSAADFSRISDWYFFAIMALADTVDFQSDPRWVAERLNITRGQAREALLTLTEVGLLQYENKVYSPTHTDIETESDIPSEELRESHKQTLRRVLKDMDTIEVSLRDIQSVTFAGDPKKLKLAKTLILNMTQKVVASLESGHRSEVYELNVQLLPISKKVK